MNKSERLETLKAWMYHNSDTDNLGHGRWTSRKECLRKYKKSITTK
jgi:hypothetical protein